VAVVVVALAALFAVVGGEYSVLDLRELQRAERVEADSVAVLGGMVDSLARQLKAIQTDPEVQERIARERYGMLREGEFVYRIERAAADSGPP